MRLKALLVVLLSLCAVSAYAQYRASIQGVVTDRKELWYRGNHYAEESGNEPDANSHHG